MTQRLVNLGVNDAKRVNQFGPSLFSAVRLIISMSTSGSRKTHMASDTILQVAENIGTTLKEKQLSAPISFCEENDMFVILPTSYGKSSLRPANLFLCLGFCRH